VLSRVADSIIEARIEITIRRDPGRLPREMAAPASQIKGPLVVGNHFINAQRRRKSDRYLPLSALFDDLIQTRSQRSGIYFFNGSERTFLIVQILIRRYSRSSQRRIEYLEGARVESQILHYFHHLREESVVLPQNDRIDIDRWEG
jgi:hypothetical protein